MPRLKSKFAFTLIELLVVIAIIGLLVTLSVLALSNARLKSRDSKRVADIKQLQTAMELFYDANDRYPTSAEFRSGSLSYVSPISGTSSYISIPVAPVPADNRCTDANNPYIYSPTVDGSSYTLSFCLGSAVNNDLNQGVKCALPGGIKSADCANKQCGDDGCGGSCGSCAFNQACSPNGLCNCIPDCASKACGDDGCGGSCGICTGDNTCGGGGISGQCGFSCGTSTISIVSISGHACNTGAPDYDNCTYNTVQIGTQCWMKQNMNIGQMITGATDQTNTGILKKYCWGNNYVNCQTDGALYQWGEVVQYLNGVSNTTDWSPVPTGNIQGICPTGWHVPSDAEQNTLDQYVTDSGQTCNAARSGSGAWGCEGAGTRLKVGGSSGFEGIPAGQRKTDTNFSSRGGYIYLWSSSYTIGSYPWYRVVGGTSTTTMVNRGHSYRTYGFSVRCLKD